MPDIESMISTQRMMCIKRYTGWKIFLIDFYLKSEGGKFLFHCNFDYGKLSVAAPPFYKQCLISWFLLTDIINPSTLEEVANEVLWNNKLICVGNKSAFSKKIYDYGMYKVGDLYDSAGELKTGMESLLSAIFPVENFLLLRTFNSFPQAWRNVLTLNRCFISACTHPFNNGTLY